MKQNILNNNSIVQLLRCLNNQSIKHINAQTPIIGRVAYVISGVILLLLIHPIANAQENVNQQVQVIKPYEPVINDAFKISELPKIVDTNKVITEFEYEVVPKRQETSFTPRQIKPARLVSEPLSKLYIGQVKAGFGSYLSPLAQVHLGSKRSKNLNWKMLLDHNSSHGKVKNEVNKKVFAGFSETEANGSLNYFTKKYKALSLGVAYNNNKNYYYGYNTSLFPNEANVPLLKDSIENQNINLIKVKANWRTNYRDSANVNYNIDLNWHTLAAKAGVGENVLKLQTNLDYFFENEFIGADVNLNYYNNSAIDDTLNGAVFKFNPWIGAFGYKWRTVVGVTTYYDQGAQKYYFYPTVSMHYNIIDYFLIPYFELNGSYNEHSYSEIYYENPFIRQSLGVRPTINKMNISFGFRGNISSKIAFNAKVKYSNIRNQYFYVNDTSSETPLQNKFDVVYDDLTRLRLLAEMSYKTGESLFLTLKTNYFKYDLKSEMNAWHMPEYNVGLNARYILQKKIVLDASIFAIGDRPVREFDENEVEYTKTLQSVIDLNLGIEYRLSKVFSAFGYFNNISSVKYQKWNNYPTQRFNFMLGLSYSF